jgi:hypothetical protein
MTQPRQRRDAFSACRSGVFAALAAVLIAGGAAPAAANDEPLPRSKPSVTAPATPSATRAAPRVSAERRAQRRTVQQRERIRVAEAQRRESECVLFFCWRNFPLLLGVGY